MSGMIIRQVAKQYGDVRALDAVNLDIQPGKIYGLLGRNGAGKSTLLNIIASRVPPTSGTVQIDGQPGWENDAAQREVYLMSEKALFPEGMRAREVFDWTARFYPRFDRTFAKEAAARFSLNEKKKVKSLSTGYASILRAVTALSVGCRYVLMDEPVLGMDVHHRQVFYKLLLDRYAQTECTFVLSTHLVEEISAMLEEVIILRAGKVVRSESRETLLQAGYTATGSIAAVDAFLQGKTCIGQDTLGGLKTAYVLGARPEVPQGVEITGMDLQRMLIQLTDETLERRPL